MKKFLLWRWSYCLILSLTAARLTLAAPPRILPSETQFNKVILPLELSSHQEDGKDSAEIKVVRRELRIQPRYVRLALHNIMFTGQASLTVDGRFHIGLDREHLAPIKPWDQVGWTKDEYANRFVIGDVPIKTDSSTAATTLKFSLDRINDQQNSYRVVEITLLDVNRRKIPLLTKFVEFDPQSEKAISTAPDQLRRGKAVWTSAKLLVSPLRKIPMAGTCSECHGGTSSNAFDLSYFGFSNKAILNRVQYHGLSQKDAEALVSFIRVTAKKKGIKALGRPYNPPFQTGPHAEDKGPEGFIAGAGYKAVVTEEEATAQYAALLKNTAKSPSRRLDGLNLRLVPGAIPHPFIQDWWPLVAPVSLMQAVNPSAAAMLKTREEEMRQQFERAASPYIEDSSAVKYGDEYFDAGIGAFGGAKKSLTFASVDDEARFDHSLNLYQTLTSLDASYPVTVAAASPIRSISRPELGVILAPYNVITGLKAQRSSPGSAKPAHHWEFPASSWRYHLSGLAWDTVQFAMLSTYQTPKAGAVLSGVNFEYGYHGIAIQSAADQGHLSTSSQLRAMIHSALVMQHVGSIDFLHRAEGYMWIVRLVKGESLFGKLPPDLRNAMRDVLTPYYFGAYMSYPKERLDYFFNAKNIAESVDDPYYSQPTSDVYFGRTSRQDPTYLSKYLSILEAQAAVLGIPIEPGSEFDAVLKRYHRGVDAYKASKSGRSGTKEALSKNTNGW